MKKEQKRISYKLAEGCPATTNLQERLGAALGRFKKTGDRRHSIGTAGEHLRFINVHRTHEGVLYGVFHSLTPGAAQLIIDMEGDTYSVESLLPSEAGSKDAEFVEGTLFFGVWLNHVLVLQSAACRAQQLEDHLTWLIDKEMKADGGSNTSVPLIQLVDPLDPDLRSKALVGVTGIKLGASLETKEVKSPKHVADGPAIPESTRYAIPKKVLHALAVILQIDSKAMEDDREFNAALESGDVRAVLELTCLKKKVDSTAGEVMTALARTFRNLDETDVEVTLADGTKVKGDQTKIGQPHSVECIDRLPIPESVFAEMHKYFRELIDSDRIHETKPFGNVK